MPTPFVVAQGSVPAPWTLTLTGGTAAGAALDLTSASVQATLYVFDSGGVTKTPVSGWSTPRALAVIAPATAGQARLTWQSGDFAALGAYELDIQVVQGGAVVAAVNPIPLVVTASGVALTMRAAFVAALAGGLEGEGAVVPIAPPGQAPSPPRVLPTDAGVGVSITITDLPTTVTPAITLTTKAYLAANAAVLTSVPAFATLVSVAGNTVTLAVGTGAQAVGDIYLIDVTLTDSVTHNPLGALRLYLPCADA